MKKLILAATLALSFNVVAETKTPEQICGDLSKAAGHIMEARQLNTDIIKLVEIADGDKVIINMIKAAYNQPIYAMKENKAAAVTTFKNDVFLVCYESFVQGVTNETHK